MIGYYPINPAAQDNEDAFGPRFFRTHFVDYMRQVCAVDGQTPVLELVLASGQVLDVSHILELKPDYMLVSVFRDERTCEDTYNTYLRYQTIFRINVLTRPHEDRPIGFSMQNMPAVLDTDRAAPDNGREKKKPARRK
ncbi:MAG: hypothetical protein HS108_00805 [Planctomycetes bacterium]|nr:hypothetical protein [Planctomycetota bacterium]MCL4731776.1 hypothetical protein [Planctomycetota bacterium]